MLICIIHTIFTAKIFFTAAIIWFPVHFNYSFILNLLERMYDKHLIVDYRKHIIVVLIKICTIILFTQYLAQQ